MKMKGVFFYVLFFLSVTMLFSFKIGFVDLQHVFAKHPDYKKFNYYATNVGKDRVLSYENSLKLKKLENEKEKIENTSKKVNSEEVKKILSQKLLNVTSQIKGFMKGKKLLGSSEIQKEADFYKEMISKEINFYLSQVAKRENIDIVFDVSKRQILPTPAPRFVYHPDTRGDLEKITFFNDKDVQNLSKDKEKLSHFEGLDLARKKQILKRRLNNYGPYINHYRNLLRNKLFLYQKKGFKFEIRRELLDEELMKFFSKKGGEGQ